MVIQVLNREDVKMNVSKLTSDVFTSEQIINTVQKVLGDAVVSEYVKVCSIQLGRETTNAILNDSIVRKNLSGKFKKNHWEYTHRFEQYTFNLFCSDALYSTITPTFFKKRATPTVVAKSEKPAEQTQPSPSTSEHSQVQNQSYQSSKSDQPVADNENIDEEAKQISSIEDSLPIYW